MSTTVGADYALERTPREYERLRAQARVWESATERILDQVGITPGASCLDAGCGPGETMRLLARRAGPDGEVTGIDADASIGVLAEASLHGAGHLQCRFRAAELTGHAPVPGGPYDVVYARLLLFHLPQRVRVLSRLWDAVAPGGHLVVQDYDLDAMEVVPWTAGVDEVGRVILGAFDALGCDVRAGVHLSRLFAEAGVGAPDGTDVAGRIEPLGTGYRMLEQVFQSVLPAATAHDVTDERNAGIALAQLRRDAHDHPRSAMLWPLLLGAWKRKR